MPQCCAITQTVKLFLLELKTIQFFLTAEIVHAQCGCCPQDYESSFILQAILLTSLRIEGILKSGSDVLYPEYRFNLCSTLDSPSLIFIGQIGSGRYQGLSKGWLWHYATGFDVLQSLASHQNEHPIELVLEDPHQLGQALVPHHHAVGDRSSYKHVVGSQRQAFEDVIASPYSSIDENRNLVADCCLDERQDVDWRGNAVQLSASVVGDPNCIAVVERNLSVFRVHYAFKDYLQLCQTADFLDGLPGHGKVAVGQQFSPIRVLTCVGYGTDFLKNWEDKFGSIKNVLDFSPSGSQHLRIDGDCQPCKPILLCQSYLTHRKCPIIGDVHLHESQPTTILSCDIRVRLCGECTQPEDNIILSCYPCGDELSIRVREHVHRPWRESKGKGEWSVEDGGGEVSFGGADENSWDDHQFMEAGFVFFEGLLVLAA